MKKVLLRNSLSIAYIIVIFIVIFMYYYLFSRIKENQEIQMGSVNLIEIKESDFSEENIVEDKKDNTDNIEENAQAMLSIENGESQSENVSNEIQKQVPSTTVYTTSDEDYYTVIGTLVIDKIGLNMSILSKTTDELLRMSACRLWGPSANEVGNLCIIGHNYRNSKLFSKVPNLEEGDVFSIIDTNNITVQYRIYDKYTVEPDNVNCLDEETGGKKIVTLITCTNDSKRRIILKAEEI